MDWERWICWGLVALPLMFAVSYHVESFLSIFLHISIGTGTMMLYEASIRRGK